RFLRLPSCPLLFPYTTLFRSRDGDGLRRGDGGHSALLRRLARGPHREHLCQVDPIVARSVDVGRWHEADAAHGLAYSRFVARRRDRKSTRLNSSHVAISYAVF